MCDTRRERSVVGGSCHFKRWWAEAGCSERDFLQEKVQQFGFYQQEPYSVVESVKCGGCWTVQFRYARSFEKCSSVYFAMVCVSIVHNLIHDLALIVGCGRRASITRATLLHIYGDPTRKHSTMLSMYSFG